MVCHGYGKNFVIANSSTGISQSVVCPNKSNRVVIAMIGWTPSSVNISAISYGGANLTLIANTDVTNSNGVTARSAIYGLVAPATGSNTFVLTPSGTVDLSVQLYFLYNVDQGTSFSGGTSSTGNAIAPTMSAGGTTNTEDMIYDTLAFLTPGSVISNDGTAGNPQSWLSAYLTRGGGPIQVTTECGLSSNPSTLAWQTLDGGTHQYAWSSVCVHGVAGNTEIYDISFDNTTDANSACDASTFNFDTFVAGDVGTVNTGVGHFNTPAAEFTTTQSSAPNAAREWFNRNELYTSYWVRVDTLPTGNWCNVIWQGTYSDSGDINIDINTDGSLQLRINSAVKGNTTFKCSLGVWFKVSCHHKVNGASSVYEIKINDGQETHTYTDNVAQSPLNLIQIGVDNNNTNCHIYFDDLKADTAQYPNESPKLRNIKVGGVASDKASRATPSEYGTSVLNNSFTTNLATYQSGSSYTPTQNALLLAWVMLSGTTIPDVGTMWGNACTWTRLSHFPIGSTGNLECFIARSATAAAGTVMWSANTATSTPTGCIMIVTQWPNAFIASPTDNGSSAIVQVKTTIGTAVTSGTIAMNAFGTHRSWSSSAAGWGINAAANTMSAKYGYRVIGTNGYSTPSTSAFAEYKVQGENPAASWTTSTAGGGIAVEIQGPVIHKRTATKILNAFKAIVGQTKITSGATVRTLISARNSIARVSRRSSLIRKATSSRVASDSVKRLGTYVRKLSIIRPATDSVKRFGSYIKRVSVGLPISLSVKRLGSYIRKVSDGVKIALSVSQSKIGGAVHAVTVSTILAIRAVVSRRSLYLRIAQVREPIVLSVRRSGSYLRTNVVVRPVSYIVSRLRGFRRSLAIQIQAVMVVSRVSSRLRKALAQVAPKFTVSRVASYIRRIATAIVRASRVAQSKASAVEQSSTVSLVIAGTMRVSRSARYLRKVVVAVAPYPVVSRIARYLRKVITSVVEKIRAQAIRTSVRALVSSIAISLKATRRTSYLRFLSVGRPNGFSVKRIGTYIRRALLKTTIRALVGLSRFTGEPILLKVLATLNAKLAYLTNSSQKTSFTSNSNTKDNYKT
jgi:hypothetical protein